METLDDELQRLLKSACEGDRAALAALAERFGPDLIRVARRTMPRRLRSMFDSQDIVQAVWATFLRNDVDVGRFDSPDELLAYLRGIASHKVTEQVRKRLLARKATLNREVTMSACGGETFAARRRDTPSQLAIARERFEGLVRDLAPHHRRVVELKAAGASAAEIAAEVGLNEGTVRRILAKASERANGR